MEQRTLAGTDLRCSRVIFGTMAFGSQVDEDEADRMVHAAVDAGITMFDTANSYNDGRAEQMLGKAVKPFRDEILLSTKAFRPIDGPGTGGLGKAAIQQALDHSLRRLDTDHVDLYYLHMPDWDTPVEETLAALESLVAAGKVRYTGSSNFAAWQMCQMLWVADRHGWQSPRVAQQMYNLIARRVEDEYESFAHHLDITTIAYNPLAGGLLTGKHSLDGSTGDGRFSREMYKQRYWNAAQFEAVASLKGIAADAGMSLIELSYRWLLSRPLVGCMLLGASSEEQLARNLCALQGPAPDTDTVARCDEVWSTLSGAAPLYNR